MSGSISSMQGLLGALVQDSSGVRQRLNTLTLQAADGKIAESFAGLAAGGATSLSVAPAVAHNQAWQNNIDAASGRMGVTQTALSQISQIASDFYAKTDSLNGLDSSTVDSVAASARDALQQVAALLNSRDGNVYVFAGQDSANPPVPNADQIGTSGFVTSIANAIGNLATAGAAATTAATLGVASSNASGTSPFSTASSQPAAALSGAQPSIQVGDGTQVAVGIAASSNADVVSGGASTTGSYMRDVMRALATLGSLSSAQIGAGGFSAVVADTRTSLGGAITALNQDAGVLGDRTTALAATKTGLAAANTALQGQVSGAEDVDMAVTLSSLAQTQTQLQASYQLIAGLQSMSLTKFLTV